MTRDAAIEKLVKLAMVTVENGATPEEERSAQEAGTRLIRRFSLRLEEVEAAAERERERMGPRRPPRPPTPEPVFVFGGPTTGTGSHSQFYGVWVRY